MRVKGVGGDALPEQALAQALGIVGQQQLAGLGLEKSAVVPRAVLLVTRLVQERAAERTRVRPRENGEGREPVRILVAHAPRDLPAPIVTDQMETPVGMTGCRGDLDRIVDQLVEGVVRQVGGSGSGPR